VSKQLGQKCWAKKKRGKTRGKTRANVATEFRGPPNDT